MALHGGGVPKKPKKHEEGPKIPMEWALEEARMRAAQRVRRRELERMKQLSLSTKRVEMPKVRFGVAVIKKVPVPEMSATFAPPRPDLVHPVLSHKKAKLK
jgi:hypothetical protein